MDELQDHVDDTIFSKEVQDTVPKPTKFWKRPSAEDVDTYVSTAITKPDRCLELEGICSNCLGFYMFTRYLRDIGKVIFAEFLIDVAIYKKTHRMLRREIAAVIVSRYLSPSGCKFPVERNPPVPCNLCRSQPMTDDSLRWRKYIDAESECNILKIVGSPLETVHEVIESCEEGKEDYPPILFDELEYIVFSCMRCNHFDNFKQTSRYTEYLHFMILSEQPASADDFTLFRVLGRGGFGVVNGCKHRQTGKLYAMKVMDRKRIKLMKAEMLILAERATLTMLDSPFVVGLKYAFSSPEELYLILDLMTGGDLGYALYKRGPFKQQEAMYYGVRTLLGLKALHDLGVVFRDLKPENILMDGTGKTKLSDLGLAVRVSKNGITGTCGSRGYWAPEMLRRDQHGRRIRYRLSVDWFSFGCVMYEFLSGICPFRSVEARKWKGIESREQAMDTATLEMEPTFNPVLFDETAIDFIQKLLCKDERQRLGAQGPQEVMQHPFFADVNWEAHIADQVPPPYVPNKELHVASQNEIGQFEDKRGDSLQLTSLDMEIFEGWDYIRSNAFLEEVVGFKTFEEKHGRIAVFDPGNMCCNIS
mmetsp:Transcript_22856/g.33385  ORF Transcript_22856/g.33385 Transcript_22856/m.33385 type:complete len:590 (-) Transcript_22856:230-1999(-)